MDKFPTRPTVIPQARKYTRQFDAQAGKVFTDNETVVIEIPPIANSYLTKDARIYFKFDMSFYDHSFTEAAQTGSLKWFDAAAAKASSPLECLRKPVPMLDVCGPYGFFREVEVYDYLGNTLLEKTNRHDLLASMLADFYLDPEVDRLRPPIAESQLYDVNVTSTSAIDYGLNRSFGEPKVHTRVNGINLLDAEQNGYLNTTDMSRFEYFSKYIQTAPTNPSTLVKVPTWGFSIALLNFLGRGSNSFVPLHNGYRILLKINKRNVPIKFSLPSGGLTLKVPTVPGSTTGFVETTIVPRLTEFNLYNIYLKADILEVSPQFDEKIDKVVHARMNSYVALGRCDKPTIVPGNFLSVNNFNISMRHIPLSTDLTVSELGYRSRTYVNKARILYNGAVQQEYKNVDEIRNALGSEFDTLITTAAFTEEHPTDILYGASGYMYPYMSHEFKYDVAQIPLSSYATAPQYYAWVNPVWNPTAANQNTFFTRFNNQAGKFLLRFDSTLNGSQENTITGIDTTKTTISIDLKRESNDNDPYETDVFIDHDAIITITPGKSTSVSF